MYLDLLCDLLPRSLERVCVLRGLRERLLLLDLDRRLDLLRLESDPEKKIMLEKWLHINHLHNQLTNLPVPWAGPWIPPSWPWTRAGSLLLVLLVCRNRIEKNMYRNTNSNSPLPPQKNKTSCLDFNPPTSWFNCSRNKRLSFSDSLHGLFHFFISWIDFQTCSKVQACSQWVQPKEKKSLAERSFLKTPLQTEVLNQLADNVTDTLFVFIQTYFGSVINFSNWSVACEGKKKKKINKCIVYHVCFPYKGLAQPKKKNHHYLTWEFMLGKPKAAIGSMFENKGFPIYKIRALLKKVIFNQSNTICI